MNNSNVLEFDPEEVIIRIKPGLTGDRKWNGNIDINLDAFENSPLESTQFNALINLAQMMMRVPELLEEDEYIRDTFGPYMSNAFDMKVSTIEDKGRTAKLIKFSDFKKD